LFLFQKHNRKQKVHDPRVNERLVFEDRMSLYYHHEAV